MKFTLKALSLALATTASGVALADESSKLPLGLEFSGSAAITTDYRFRGISQTQNDPAIQVGLHLAHSSGLYAGVWGSNIDFGNDAPKLELDPYLGYSYTFEDVNLKPWVDVGVWRYGYPSYTKNFAFTEYYVRGGLSDVIAEGDGFNTTINYTNSYGKTDKDSWYFSLGYAVPFADTGFGANVNVGYTTVKDYVAYNGGFNGKNHYTDWKLGVTYDFKSISGFTAELAAIGTDISKKGKSKDEKRLNETGAVFTLTKSF
jgi:uncharacterized protein (TIGR02001 family)